ncbi:HOC1 [Scenedesmus sp. PABB004]|nr:HOC1 [Scenedesmus sp. PABB004]
MRAFVAERYPQLLPLPYDAFLSGAERADVWRVLVLHALGGVYADVDVVCLKPVEAWSAEHGHDAAVLLGVENYDEARLHPLHVVNWALAAVPGHPLLGRAFPAAVSAAVQRQFFAAAADGKPVSGAAYEAGIIDRTGPAALSAALYAWFAAAGVPDPAALTYANVTSAGGLAVGGVRVAPIDRLGAGWETAAARREGGNVTCADVAAKHPRAWVCHQFHARELAPGARRGAPLDLTSPLEAGLPAAPPPGAKPADGSPAARAPAHGARASLRRSSASFWRLAEELGGSGNQGDDAAPSPAAAAGGGDSGLQQHLLAPDSPPPAAAGGEQPGAVSAAAASALLAAASDVRVVAALAALSRSDLIPLRRDDDGSGSIDATLAWCLEVGRRAGVLDQLEPHAVLTLLWMAESFHSQYRSSAGWSLYEFSFTATGLPVGDARVQACLRDELPRLLAWQRRILQGCAFRVWVEAPALAAAEAALRGGGGGAALAALRGAVAARQRADGEALAALGPRALVGEAGGEQGEAPAEDGRASSPEFGSRRSHATGRQELKGAPDAGARPAAAAGGGRRPLGPKQQLLHLTTSAGAQQHAPRKRARSESGGGRGAAGQAASARPGKAARGGGGARHVVLGAALPTGGGQP